jgi:hypothetical protein
LKAIKVNGHVLYNRPVATSLITRFQNPFLHLATFLRIATSSSGKQGSIYSQIKPCFMEFKSKLVQQIITQTNKRFGITRLLSTLVLLTLVSFNASAQVINIDGHTGDWSGKTYNAYSHDANNSNDNQFTQGSKDGGAISSWAWSNGQTNNKGDITNGAAILGTEMVGGVSHNILYFAGDRAVNNGDAAIGFWFFKSAVSLIGTTAGTFSGTHTNGDLLVVSHFTQGGGQADIFIYVWNNGALTGPTTSSTAAVNSGVEAVPNGFTYVANSYPIGDFFEGKVDLTIQNLSPCFANFLLETRNSQSITASLQDLTFGSFTTTIDPPNVSYLEPACTDNTFRVQVINPLVGYSYRLTQNDGNIVNVGPYASGSLIFTGLHIGQGFSVVSISPAGCISSPRACTE